MLTNCLLTDTLHYFPQSLLEGLMLIRELQQYYEQYCQLNKRKFLATY